MAWPDVERLAVAYLSERLGVRVSTKVPNNLTSVLPMVRIIRGAGSDDGITDSPLLDVEAFAGDQPAASALAEDAREALHDLAGRAVNGDLVDTVATATGPVRLDWGNPAVERYVASYRLGLRRKRPSDTFDDVFADVF